MQWISLEKLSIEGQGWMCTDHPFDRLPSIAREQVDPELWRLSQHSSGLSARFQTNSSRVAIRWKLRQTLSLDPLMSRSGESGFDLYVHHRNAWELLGVAGAGDSQDTERELVVGLPMHPRRYLIHFPLYNGIATAFLGVDDDASFEMEIARDHSALPPLIFYGTSITQGAFASRSGMSYPAILGRRLDHPIINLGFAGMGHMEPSIGALLSELPAAAYVLDVVPNLTSDLIRDRATPFLAQIRHHHPDTPIILLESVERTIAHHDPSWGKHLRLSQQALRDTFQRRVDDGDLNLRYVTAQELLGINGEMTVDGTHPSDLGFSWIADVLQRPLMNAISRITTS